MAGRKISGVFVPIQLDTSNVQRDLESLNKNIGTVIGSIQDKFEGALNTKALADNVVKVTRSLGELRDSANALGQINGVNIFRDKMGALPSALKSISEAFGGTIQQQRELYTQLVKTQAIDQQVKALQTLQRATRLSTEETLALVKARGMVVSSEAAKAFAAPTTATAQGGRGIAGIFTPSSISAGAQSALAATGVVTGMYGVVELTKSAYQASLKMDNLNLAFESIFGSGAKAAAQLDFVREVSDKLGLSFLDTSEGAKKLFAAARGTEVEKDVNQIFKAFSTMSAALKLTGDETNSVFLAISQMISKGKVSAEELRLQLAERMPGAVNLFAKAIGVTTKELDKMLQNGQVGLDALRKFAVEVQNTYAEGAAGASRGLQAELNRVGNAWFDLKRAFVDAQGTASSLSIITSSLKAITAVAPEIMALTGAVAKFAISFGAAYAAIKAFTSIQTLFATGMTAIRSIMTASLATPLGLAAVFGTLVASVWSFSSAQKSGMEAISAYSYEMDKLGEASGTAADKLNQLNESVRARAVTLQAAKAETTMGLFAKAALPTQQDPYRFLRGTAIGEEMGVGEQARSAFVQSLETLKSSGGAYNKFIGAAQDLGDSFGQEFSAAVATGADEKGIKGILDKYAIEFSLIKEQMTQAGASPEVLKSYSEFASNLLGVANAADSAKRVLEDMQDTNKQSTQYLLDFANAYDAIKKATKETELGKSLNYSEEATASAQALVKMFSAVQTAKQRLSELGQQAADNITEWQANEAIIKNNENAFILLGQAAVKNKTDLSVLQEAIRVVGEAAKLTAEQVKELQDKAAAGFRVGGVQATTNIIADLQTEQIMAGATSGQKKAFSNLASYVKDESSKLTLAQAILKGSAKDVQATFKNTAISIEDTQKILQQANATAAAEDAASAAKKTKGNWETMNSAIEAATKTLDTWRGKVAESKADQFGASIQAEVDKIDKALRSSKGTSEQVAQLKQLRAQILETGEARKKQIADEQRLTEMKELTRVGTRVTGAYKKLEGVDNAEVYDAAKAQYDLDVEYYKKAKDKKLVSDEEFASKVKMLDAILADARLRSQTDMYSRLQVAANDYYKKYGDFTRNIGNVITEAMDSTAKGIAAFARSGAQDFASLASAFQSMADKMLVTATDLFAQQAVSALWKGVGDLVGSMFSPFGGAYSSGTVQEVPRGALYGPSAKGNVFSGGNLSSYSGSVVSSPTVFTAGARMPAYATGAGLMGEAGPEAIMPLVRTSSGHLGVRSEGAGASNLQQQINVQVNNNSNAQVQTQQSTDNQGNLNIEVMIEETVAKSMRRPGSAPYKAIQNQWNGSPALARRM